LKELSVNYGRNRFIEPVPGLCPQRGQVEVVVGHPHHLDRAGGPEFGDAGTAFNR
jgi:hypothetical protein